LNFDGLTAELLIPRGGGDGGGGLENVAKTIEPLAREIAPGR